jgi:hypothetical protein
MATDRDLVLILGLLLICYKIAADFDYRFPAKELFYGLL